jgi:hypothetical protein
MANLRSMIWVGMFSVTLWACSKHDPVVQSPVIPQPSPTAAGVTISGKLVSADGNTPIQGGLIYVEGASLVDPGATASACGAPPEKNWVSTCSLADGSFSLRLLSELPPSAKLVLVKDGVRLEQVFAAEPLGSIDAGVVKLAVEASAASALLPSEANPG